MAGIFCYQDKIEKMYYKHGLAVSNYPVVVISFSCLIILFCCYPLWNLPLPGNGPDEYSIPLSIQPNDINNVAKEHVESSTKPPPPWIFDSEPEAFIQQFIVKSTVQPWNKTTMEVTDAFRAPLAKLFNLIEEIGDFKTVSDEKEFSVSEDCYRVSESIHARKPIKSLLPEYNCLMVSPVSFWGGDKQKFIQDANIMHTVHKYEGKTIKTSPSLKALLFGIKSKDTGMKNFAVRNRQRVVTYAVTLVLRKYNKRLIDDLRAKLSSLHPTHLSDHMCNSSHCEEPITNVYFKSQFSVTEFIPLMTTYFIMGCYIYFSVRKINLVKSKLGMAFSAVICIMASLMMSVGVCSFFGITPTLNGGDIFPYLVIVIGLENILVVTKSVVATPLHLDVDKRIALGISREGCSITKNIVLELVLICCGYFTFVPEIQELCKFAVVGVVVDFFLQMFFFLTILSVDIRRLDITEEMYANEEEQNDNEYLKPSPQVPHWTPGTTSKNKNSMLSNLRAKRKRRSAQNDSHTVEVGGANITILKIPKRLQVLFFWADTRMVQRGLMVFMIIWSAYIMYGDPWSLRSGSPSNVIQHVEPDINKNINDNLPDKLMPVDSMGNLVWRESDFLTHRQLSHRHWPTLFGYYNISLAQKYISILPSIPLSMVIPPEEAIKYRYYGNQEEQQPLVQETAQEEPIGHQMHSAYPMYRMTGLDYYLTLSVGAVSGMMMVFLLTVLYRCICTRNYAKWRSRGRKNRSKYSGAVSESLPLVLSGHPQTVECMAYDGNRIISCDLGGEIRVWDRHTGECTCTLHRITSPVPERYPLEGALDEKPSTLGYQAKDNVYELPHVNSEPSLNPHGELFHRKVSSASKGHHRTGSVELTRQNNIDFNSINLASAINTNFAQLQKEKLKKKTSSEASSEDGSKGYNFKKVVDEHLKDQMYLLTDDYDILMHQRSHSRSPSQPKPISPPANHSWNMDDMVINSCGSYESGLMGNSGWTSWSSVSGTPIEMQNGPAIWCLLAKQNLVMAGCEDGRIEIWDGESGLLKCSHDVGKAGVIAMVVDGNRLVVARISGSLDFFNMEVTNFNNTPVQYRGSNSSRLNPHNNDYMHSDLLTLQLVYTVKSVHQQPISVFKIAFGRVCTGSFDHTLKVFTVQDARCLFTMFGHTAPITALYMDTVSPSGCASGSSDGMVRLWDLPTGECLHQLDEHEGEIVALECTPDLVVSMGQDEKMCIWGRRSGMLLHVCNLTNNCSMTMCLLGNCWSVTPGESSIQLWDIRNGELIKTIEFLDDAQVPSSRITQITAVGNLSVAVDYGNELRIVRFPSVLEKID